MALLTLSKTEDNFAKISNAKVYNMYVCFKLFNDTGSHY